MVDSTCDRFIVTRQVQGDGGISSDLVVLTGTVPDLTGSAADSAAD